MRAVHADTQFLPVLADKEHEQQHIRQNDPDSGNHADILIRRGSNLRVAYPRSDFHCCQLALVLAAAKTAGRRRVSIAFTIAVNLNDYGVCEVSRRKRGLH
jgi:hypothetical protein